jgi:hypothetical protein
MAAHMQESSSLPVRGSLKLVYAFSLGIALLTAAVSSAGLLFSAAEHG